MMIKYRALFPFEFVLMMGDNLYGGEAPQDFEKKFAEPYRELLNNKVKFYATLGNHDQALQGLWRESQKTINSYLETLRKLAQLQFFKRLLSWWHILHLPIFIMMFITSVIHIWAVHRY